jgi:hypothetical protein
MRSTHRHGCNFHVMSRTEIPWGWVVALLVGLYFFGSNLAEGDWIMVGLATFVMIFSAVQLIRRRTPPGAAR